jgi:hypothetical protein
MTNRHIAIGTQFVLPVGRSLWLVLARVPGDIEPIEHNPEVRCQHSEDTRQYLDKDCFLAPLSAAGSSDKSSGTVAVVAGLIAAVKLTRVESIEVTEPESAGALCDLRLDYACTHGDRGKQVQVNWQQAKARRGNSSMRPAAENVRVFGFRRRGCDMKAHQESHQW